MDSQTTDSRPIGLFDSGIGGLTVLRSLMQSLPNESFVYLGDTARLPYGSKSPATIERYLQQNIRCLQTQNVKAIVVACNSASTVLLDRESVFALPVYNVIEPGAETAVATSANRKIGVLGTKATIGARAYVRAIGKIDQTITVYQQACPLLVPLVEEGWEDDPLTNLVIYRYIGPLLQAGIDTLILGCTHYPALKPAIQKVVGSAVQLVDSSQAIVRRIQADMASGALGAATERSDVRVLATDISPGFIDVATRLMHPHVLPSFEGIDL